jgi:hypothetical protein
MEIELTFFEAEDLRAAGAVLTQVTGTARSLHATEVYRMDATDAPLAYAVLGRMSPAEVAECNRLLSMV